MHSVDHNARTVDEIGKPLQTREGEGARVDQSIRAAGEAQSAIDATVLLLVVQSIRRLCLSFRGDRKAGAAPCEALPCERVRSAVCPFKPARRLSARLQLLYAVGVEWEKLLET